MTAPAPQIRLRGVNKHFGAIHVLKDIDIDIPKGRFVALVGPSGCGKSTLLRSIAGLETVSGGDIEIGGVRVNDMPPRKRDVAMVFQSYALYPHMDVGRNMTFALRLRRQPGAVIADHLGAVARTLGLDGLVSRFPRQLSGGQRQRVAMGRAIIRDPRVFLFDEPLSNLDAQLRVQMRAEVRGLHDRLGATSVYVTHDQIEAMTMADDVVVLESGRIAQQGPPLALYDRPANIFVASFIGSPAMNFFDGLYGTVDRAVRLTDGQVVPVPNPPPPDGAAITIGIRPEHLHLRAPGPGELALSGTLKAVEPTGAATYCLFDCAGVSTVLSTTERLFLKPGTPVTVSFEPGHVHTFDTATRLRLNPA